MAADEGQALERVAQAALTQLDLLLSGRQSHPPADEANLARSCLDLLLRALASELGPLEKEKRVYAALRARLDEYQRASIRAPQHLVTLSKDWRCAKCSSNVAAAASVRAVRGDKTRLELICLACGTRSAASATGERAFHELFGHLLNDGWNPAANGFAP
jgi:hypothetical protein